MLIVLNNVTNTAIDPKAIVGMEKANKEKLRRLSFFNSEVYTEYKIMIELVTKNFIVMAYESKSVRDNDWDSIPYEVNK